MKKLLLLGTAAGALCAANGAQASPWIYQPHANLALYGSYMDQNNNQSGLNPGGGGGGVQLGLSLTPNFFVSGSYQYNYLTESNAPAAASSFLNCFPVFVRRFGPTGLARLSPCCNGPKLAGLIRHRALPTARSRSKKLLTISSFAQHPTLRCLETARLQPCRNGRKIDADW